MFISVHHVVDKHNLNTLIIFSFISFLINQQVTTILSIILNRCSYPGYIMEILLNISKRNSTSNLI